MLTNLFENPTFHKLLGIFLTAWEAFTGTGLHSTAHIVGAAIGAGYASVVHLAQSRVKVSQTASAAGADFMKALKEIL